MTDIDVQVDVLLAGEVRRDLQEAAQRAAVALAQPGMVVDPTREMARNRCPRSQHDPPERVGTSKIGPAATNSEPQRRNAVQARPSSALGGGHKSVDKISGRVWAMTVHWVAQLSFQWITGGKSLSLASPVAAGGTKRARGVTWP